MRTFPTKSFTLGQPFGIQVQIHGLFLWFVGILTLMAGLTGGIGEAFWTLAFLVALFGCVTLHELGHCLAARHFRIRVRGITLFPLGGIAEIEQVGVSPRAEFWIALAGPAVNMILAFLLTPIAYLTQGASLPIADTLLVMNVAMALFNLLPAFPLDGGRILRSHLCKRWGNRVRATEKAVAIGQKIALALGLLGLFYNPWLILIALFIYVMGQQELQMVRVSDGGVRYAPNSDSFPFSNPFQNPPSPTSGREHPIRRFVVRSPFGPFHLPRR